MNSRAFYIQPSDMSYTKVIVTNTSDFPGGDPTIPSNLAQITNQLIDKPPCTALDLNQALNDYAVLTLPILSSIERKLDVLTRIDEKLAAAQTGTTPLWTNQDKIKVNILDSFSSTLSNWIDKDANRLVETNPVHTYHTRLTTGKATNVTLPMTCLAGITGQGDFLGNYNVVTVLPRIRRDDSDGEAIVATPAFYDIDAPPPFEVLGAPSETAVTPAASAVEEHSEPAVAAETPTARDLELADLLSRIQNLLKPLP